MVNYALGVVPTHRMPFAMARASDRPRRRSRADHRDLPARRSGRVADGAVVLDIGANIGTFSVYAATSARDVTIYAYEPAAGFFGSCGQRPPERAGAR